MGGGCWICDCMEVVMDAMSGLGDMVEGGRCAAGLGGFATAYAEGRIMDVIPVSGDWRSKRAAGIKR